MFTYVEEEAIEVTPLELETLPNEMFRVAIDGNGHHMPTSVSGKMRKNFMRVLPGDEVLV
ncbi:MAG: translation initiation factor IF-1 [Acidobacteriota bacterium]